MTGSFTDSAWSSTGELAVVRRGQLLVGSVGRGGLRWLAQGGSPSFSPDGSRIALVHGGWVWVERVRDRRSLRLVRGRAPAWSPDGQAIAYVGARDAVYVVAARGGRSRRVTRVRGRSVDWQPLRPSAGCNLTGASVLASSAGAVVYSRVIGAPGDTHTSWYGCVRAVGREQLLLSAPSIADTETLRLEHVALTGHYAALAFFFSDQYYTDDSETIDVYDLSTGKGAAPIATTCFAPYEPCGIESLVLNSSGFTAWHLPKTVPLYHLAGVSCPSVSLCVAVDDYGNALTAADPTGGAKAWTRANIDGTNDLTGIACPTALLCVAVDGQGRVLSSTDPAGGAGVWTPADVDGANPLAAVSCPSAALCVAVDHGGQILASTDPTAGATAWTGAVIDPGNDLTGVSCPSPTLCVAVDNAGRIFTSTNPTGGPAAWTSRLIAGLASGEQPPLFAGVSCPSVSMCVATGSGSGLVLPGPTSPPPGGRAVVSTNPTGGAAAWTSTPVGPVFFTPASVSCASASLCVIAGGEGIISSTNPTGGQTNWSYVPLHGGAGSAIPGISCRSAALCAAVDTQGNIITSTNPGGTNAWMVTSVDLPPCSGSTPCQDEQIYAHDSHGTRVIDSIKFPGSGKSLANLHLSGNQLTWTHDGNPRSAALG